MNAWLVKALVNDPDLPSLYAEEFLVAAKDIAGAEVALRWHLEARKEAVEEVLEIRRVAHEVIDSTGRLVE